MTPGATIVATAISVAKGTTVAIAIESAEVIGVAQGSFVTVAISVISGTVYHRTTNDRRRVATRSRNCPPSRTTGISGKLCQETHRNRRRGWKIGEGIEADCPLSRVQFGRIANC